jgi:hypothetical protein
MPADIEKTRDAVAAKDGMVRALLVERGGYVRRGLPERVAQVDEQLRAHGYPTDGLPTPGKGIPSDSPPKNRRAPKATSTAAEPGDGAGE